MNINSVRNKFESVRAAISNYVDIFIAVKSLLTVLFAVDGFHKSRSILVFVRLYLLFRQLTKHQISSNIQALVFEINLRKEKWFFLSLYRPPSQNCQYFLYSLQILISIQAFMTIIWCQVILIWFLLMRSF